jgi:6-phosphogluconolactonase
MLAWREEPMTMNGRASGVTVTMVAIAAAILSIAGCQSSGGRKSPVTRYFLYAANTHGDNVSAYSIDTSSGALAAVGGSPFAAGTGPAGVAADPMGRFLYVANYRSNDVSAWAIDSSSGALTAVGGSPFAAGTGPSGVATDPTGRYLFLTNYRSEEHTSELQSPL